MYDTFIIMSSFCNIVSIFYHPNALVVYYILLSLDIYCIVHVQYTYFKSKVLNSNSTYRNVYF